VGGERLQVAPSFAQFGKILQRCERDLEHVDGTV
jgi:hypothetical protein